jgi:hypothetical protein
LSPLLLKWFHGNDREVVISGLQATDQKKKKRKKEIACWESTMPCNSTRWFREEKASLTFLVNSLKLNH